MTRSTENCSGPACAWRQARRNNEDLKAAPRLAGFNRTYLSKLEKGASYLVLEIIAKLATVLKVEPNERLRISPARPSRVAWYAVTGH